MSASPVRKILPTEAGPILVVVVVVGTTVSGSVSVLELSPHLPLDDLVRLDYFLGRCCPDDCGLCEIWLVRGSEEGHNAMV